MVCNVQPIANIFGLCAIVSMASADHDCTWTDLTTGTDAPLIGWASGVSWGDIDGDGDDDFVVASDRDGPTSMYLNDGVGGFVQISDPWLDASHTVKCPQLGDFDNDGDLDLFAVCFGEQCYLLENQDMTFVETNTELMLSLGNAGNTPGRVMARGGAWVDYDADGLLDMYISTNALANEVESDKLLKNLGKIRQEDIFVFANASPDVFADPNIGRGLVWSDFNNDGDVDLYAAAGTGCPCNWDDCVMPNNWKGRAENRLFKNVGGMFESMPVVGNDGEVEDELDHARGVTAGDYDNDGDIDLFVCNIGVSNPDSVCDEVYGGFNKLLRNDGNFVFTDVTPDALRPAGGQRACGWLDADNDGDLDLLLVPFDGDATTTLFENINNGESFVPMCEEVFGDPIYDTFNGVGCAFSDFDKDGDVDIFITFRDHDEGQLNRFLRNDLANGNHWVEIQLVGTSSNIGGIGARVRITYTDSSGTELQQIRDVRTGTSYWSQNSLVQHFGLGGRCATDSNGDGETNVTDLLAIIGDWGQDDSAADINGDGIVDVGDLLATIESWGTCTQRPEITKVEVTWPSGIHQEVVLDLMIDTIMQIKEPMGARSVNPRR